MRDWLALPINTNAGGNPSSSSSSVKNIVSSDESVTTDEDEYRYDIIHESASAEEELEVTECNNEDQNEELSTWLSILNVFGVAKNIKKKSLSSSSLSSSSTSSFSVKKSREIIPKPENDVPIDESLEDESIREEESHDDFEEESHDGFEEEDDDEEDDDEEEETTHLQRTMSSSSIASSTDTDNSTPASSQIMRSTSTPSKYYHAMTMSKITNVKICWNHGGKKVQVTGEFDNWSVSVDMVKDTEKSDCHVIDIPMDLSKDIEFKFIVDGEWRYANDLPHRTDWRGNINNVVYKKEKHLATTLVNE